MAALSYFAIVLPPYLSIAGAVGLLFWRKEDGEISMPADSRVLHLCNLLFVGLLMFIGIFFVLPIMRWAFEGVRWFELACMVMFLLLVHRLIVKVCWKFLGWTWIGLLASGPTGR